MYMLMLPEAYHHIHGDKLLMFLIVSNLLIPFLAGIHGVLVILEKIKCA